MSLTRDLPNRYHSLTLLGVVTSLLFLSSPLEAQVVTWDPVPEGHPRTAAELNGFSAHTRHLEMWDYLEQLRGVSSDCLLYTSPSPRDRQKSRMPSSA